MSDPTPPPLGHGLLAQLRRFIANPETLATTRQFANECRDPVQRERFARLAERLEEIQRHAKEHDLLTR